MVNNKLIDDFFESLLFVKDKKRMVLFVPFLFFLIWLMGFPLFGPVITQYLRETTVLKIEKGQILEIFLFSMSITSLMMGYLIDKTSKRKTILIITTIIISIITYLFTIVETSQMFTLVALLGFLSGVFLPTWGAYFADSIEIQERGRIMGLAIGCSMIISKSFILHIIKVNNSLIIISIISLLTLSIAIIKPEETQIRKKYTKRISLGSNQIAFFVIPVFLFYIVAGILFSVIFPTIQSKMNSSFYYLIWSIPFLLSSIITSILLDTRGRKTPTIISLAITGISVGILGIFGTRSGFLPIITLAIGFSSFMVYSFILWSDIAPEKSRGTYHGLGFGLIWIAVLLGLIFSGSEFGVISEEKFRSLLIFSAIIVFLCIPPLIFSIETLPEDIISRRRIDRHLKQALKAREEEERRYLKK